MKRVALFTSVMVVAAAAAAILLKVPARPIDFGAFYAAAVRIRTGHSLFLYGGYAKGFPYIHAPWEALIFLPFSLFPYGAALILWRIAGLGCFAGAVWVLWPSLRVTLFNSTNPLPLAAAAATVLPISQSLQLGQDTALFVLFITLAFRSMECGDDWAAGLWLGLASIDLHLLPLVLVLALLRRKWQMLESVFLAGVTLFAISVAVAGPLWPVACVHEQLSVGSLIGIGTLRWLLWLLHLPAEVYWGLLPLLVFLAFWLVRRSPFHRSASWLVLTAVVLNYHALSYNYASALPVLAEKCSKEKCQ